MSTAYLVAHAYTDPNGKMLPQVHACCIYSESATSLSLLPKDSAALDVYSVRATTYQEAYDLLCYTIQNLEVFAWCRPLLSEQILEPVDHFVLDGKITPGVISLLSQVLHLKADEVRAHIQRCELPMLREKALIHLNQLLENDGETARAYTRRDHDRMQREKEKETP